MGDGGYGRVGMGVWHRSSLHEFGHAAGLEDLYRFRHTPTPPAARGSYKYPGYLMTDKDSTTIPGLDRLYIQQVYRNEHGARPHN